MKQKYNIFVSYRKSASSQKAQHLLTLLESYGYKDRVSFDLDNFVGEWDYTILERIDNCTDFIVIISPTTFTYNFEIAEKQTSLYKELSTLPVDVVAQKLRGQQSVDYMRLELARAIAMNKNIVPLVQTNLQGFEFEKIKLPSDISKVQMYQAVFYNDYDKNRLFQDDAPKILSRLQTKPSKPQILISSILTLIALLIILSLIGIFFSGNSNVKSCSTVNSVYQYRPKNFIEKLIWGNKMEIRKNDVNTKFNALRDRYSCNLSESIELNKLDALYDIFTNMSYLPSYDKNASQVYIGKYEVSVSQWNAFSSHPKDEENELSPISSIDMYEINDFLDSLYHYSNKRFVLPTNELWCYAAQANLDYIYSGGNNPNEVAWNKENSSNKKHSNSDVLKQNAFDLFNMSGNVAEICKDTSIRDDKVYNIVKGGHYLSYPQGIEIVALDYIEKGESASNIGFRLVLYK